MLTPEKKLKNIGDHAQTVAICKWFKKHWSEIQVLELDKYQSRYYLCVLKLFMTPEDIIFLHSGGNLGDRGTSSEPVRRKIINKFPNHKIISLPQTIYFSNTENGRVQEEISKRIYSQHNDLTIIGRDPESGELAKTLFPKANTLCMPDFVLSLSFKYPPIINKHKKVLFCLRKDSESVLDNYDKKALVENIKYNSELFDTTLENIIPKNKRSEILDNILDYFNEFDVIVTDRYHGLIFSVILKKPTVVIRTVDHKLTSAIEWFREIEFVSFANSINEVSDSIEKVMDTKNRYIPDWNALYFDKLPEQLNLPLSRE